MILPVDERVDLERQILLNVCFEIARGTYLLGEHLPSPLVLSNKLLVNPRIVETVYRRLCNGGILTELPGRNYTLAAESREKARNLVAEWARAEVRTLRSRLLAAGFKNEEIAEMVRRTLTSIDEPDTKGNPNREPTRH